MKKKQGRKKKYKQKKQNTAKWHQNCKAYFNSN